MTAKPLAEYLRWVAEMPPVFRAEPEGFAGGTVRVRAVVADLFETLTGVTVNRSHFSFCDARDTSKTERNRLRLILAAAHVLWHPSVRASRRHTEIKRFLVEEIAALAAIVPASDLEASVEQGEERREELVRRALRAAKVAIAGESERDSEDRLRQVDSIERQRVLVGAAERERRNREVREAMAKKAAEEAAAKVSRE